ncbi:MAG: 3-phosphoshikimate 1-carboxyvinyltransferase [Ruminococcus sp.]|nr:3-phosphoshikimate 1-carboxyvinyltransferase [Ruminococcus sp.]
MDIIITPTHLSGSVTAPPSKSAAHRLLLCAALSKGESVVKNIYPSKDILATIGCLEALGARIELKGDTAYVRGIEDTPDECVLDCNESGSTLRFMIPVACALGCKATFIGRGRLPERPITPYLDELPKHGAVIEYNGTMPFTVGGKLTSGRYEIRGDISSQFITGLLYGLIFTEGDSELVMTTPLQSRPYVDMTCDALSRFGADIRKNGDIYYIKGGCRLTPQNFTVEGDYSQAAFFEVADALGCDIDIKGLNVNSYQGDKKIVEIISEIVYNNKKGLKPFDVDVSDIPDLVPILAVLGSFCEGTSYIRNAARLRIKECDRLHAMAVSLNACGGKVTEKEDELVIEGVKALTGGEVPDFNDHRIPMAMSIAAVRSEKPVIIRGAQSVSKSYPDFWEVYKDIGGIIETV